MLQETKNWKKLFQELNSNQILVLPFQIFKIFFFYFNQPVIKSFFLSVIKSSFLSVIWGFFISHHSIFFSILDISLEVGAINKLNEIGQVDHFMPVAHLTIWLFWWYLFIKTFFQEILTRNINQYPIHNSPSNISWISDLFSYFQSYFQKYHGSRRHSSRRSPGIKGLSKLQISCHGNCQFAKRWSLVIQMKKFYKITFGPCRHLANNITHVCLTLRPNKNKSTLQGTWPEKRG